MELSAMPQGVTPAQTSRSVLSARRIVLLASAAVIGAGVLFSGAHYAQRSDASFLSSPAYAQNAQRPVGFADIVEKVKPAVISVRVKEIGRASCRESVWRWVVDAWFRR